MRYRATPGGATTSGSTTPGAEAEVLCETTAATGDGLAVVSSPAISHVVDELNWNYRITWINLQPSGAILFNARVGYTSAVITPPPTTTTTTTTTTTPATTATTVPPTTTPPTTIAPAPVGGNPVFLSTPVRVYDSRPGTASGGPKNPFSPGTTRTIACTGVTIPANARGLICNITATNTAGTGYCVLYPGGSQPPATSTVNWASGGTVANAAIVGCGTNATVSLLVQLATADLVLDVTGYYL